MRFRPLALNASNIHINECMDCECERCVGDPAIRKDEASGLLEVDETEDSEGGVSPLQPSKECLDIEEDK